VGYPKTEFQKFKQLTERKKEIFENKFKTVRKFWAGNVATLPTLIYVFGNMSIRFSVKYFASSLYLRVLNRKQFFTAADIEG